MEDTLPPHNRTSYADTAAILVLRHSMCPHLLARMLAAAYARWAGQNRIAESPLSKESQWPQVVFVSLEAELKQLVRSYNDSFQIIEAMIQARFIPGIQGDPNDVPRSIVGLELESLFTEAVDYLVDNDFLAPGERRDRWVVGPKFVKLIQA